MLAENECIYNIPIKDSAATILLNDSSLILQLPKKKS